jgi:phage host-nuclease inhibitor protein Gam
MSTPKIEKISEPKTKLSDVNEFKETLRILTALMRKHDRQSATLSRRHAAASKKFEEASKPVTAEITPLLDQAFWFAFTHWNELLVGKATENVQTDYAVFKRHIDKVGSLILDHEVTARYLQNIESSDFALKLHQEVGDTAAKTLLKRLQGFVTIKVTAEVDTKELKEFLTSPDAVEVEGARVEYHNRLTLIPAQSPSQKEHGAKPTPAVRWIP